MSDSPQRIQRKRTKGWRIPEGAIYVGRPTKWGNPFHVVRDGAGWAVNDDNGSQYRSADTKIEALRECVHLYYEVEYGYRIGAFSYLDDLDVLAGLRGHDLCCWCPLDSPCHADVLLRLANEEVAR